jgi:transcriptional regulator with XRE-family HTH domain
LEVIMAHEVTPLGKELRKLRVDSGERIFDFANAIGVTSSFISALELGKKVVPEEFLGKVVKHYNLGAEAAANLAYAARLSARTVAIPLEKQSHTARELALAFAKVFPDLKDDDARELLEDVQKRVKR